MKKIIILAAFALFIFCHPAFADEIKPEKKVLIDKLMGQTGQSSATVSKQFANAIIKNMTAVLEKSNPKIDPKAFEIIREEIEKVINEAFFKDNQFFLMISPIYDKHFSEEELKQMIEFNDSPLGKKIITVMPLISAEGMQVGRALGESLAPKMERRILNRLKKEGIKINTL